MNLLDKFKTIFVNFHYFPFRQAKKFPLRVHHSVKLGKLGKKGSIVIEDPNAKIYIGFKGSFNLASKRTFWYVEDHAKLVFQGSAFIAAGSQIAVWDGGTAIFGKDFFANDNFFMTCHDKITFGNNVLIGWDVVFMDVDGHPIFKNGAPTPTHLPVTIGNNVWIASYASILKGAAIGDNSIVATKALVSKKFEKDHILIGKFNEVLAENVSFSPDHNI